MGKYRDRMCAAALIAEGYSANPEGSTREGYLDVIAPGETEQRRADMAGESSCALAVRSFMRCSGIKDARLDPPYKERQAVADVLSIAERAGAKGSRHNVPERGDVVHVFAPEHVLTVVYIVPLEGGAPGDYLVEGVEGGQRDGLGFECVARVRHRMNFNRGTDTRLDNGHTRDITTVIDMDAVGAEFGDE